MSLSSRGICHGSRSTPTEINSPRNCPKWAQSQRCGAAPHPPLFPLAQVTARKRFVKFSPIWPSDNDGNVPRGFGSTCHTARRFSIQAQELEVSHPYCLRALLSAGTQHSRASQTASDAITHSSAITKLLLRGGKRLSGRFQDKAGECQNSTGGNSAQSPRGRAVIEVLPNVLRKIMDLVCLMK